MPEVLPLLHTPYCPTFGVFRQLRTSHGPSGAEDYSPGCEPGVRVEERERTPEEWQRSAMPDQECAELRHPLPLLWSSHPAQLDTPGLHRGL